VTHPDSEIRNHEFARQLCDFGGLRYGSITPTDVDGYVEFGDRLFIFVEAKFVGGVMKRGQRLALERLVDAIHSPPRRYAAAILVNHESAGDVDMAGTNVVLWRWGGVWRRPLEKGMTLRRAINRLVAAYGTAEVIDLAVENDRRAAQLGRY
jgi:hypothetical protein